MSSEIIHITKDVIDSIPPNELGDFTRLVGEVLTFAESLGVVLTIEVQPQQPLAMGNYTLRCELRKARVKA